MSKPKHTPGPWYAVKAGPQTHITHAAGAGIPNIIATLEASPEQDKPNAMLIASAPEMLTELKRIQAEVLEHAEFGDAELASRLYRIIAKAEGRDSG